MDEGYRAVRVRRKTSKERAKARKRYRKNRSKLKRTAKQYRKKSSVRRRMKRLRAIRKRIKPKKGRRLTMADTGFTSNLSEGNMARKVIRNQPVKYAGVDHLKLIQDGDKFIISKATSHGLVDIDSANDQAKAEELFHKHFNELKSPTLKESEDFAHDTILQAYLTALLWATTDESDENGGDPMDMNYSIEDIDAESIEKVKADINTFVEKAGSLLDGLDDEQVGHDLFLTRNRHGAGFWDRGYPKEVGDGLTKIAHELGEVWPYVGDDKKIYAEAKQNESTEVKTEAEHEGSRNIYVRGKAKEGQIVKYQGNKYKVVQVLQGPNHPNNNPKYKDCSYVTVWRQDENAPKVEQEELKTDKESVVTNESNDRIKALQESIASFDSALNENKDKGYSSAFKAVDRTAKRLEEAYTRLKSNMKPIVESTQYDEFNMDLPSFAGDQEELSEGFESIVGVKPLVESKSEDQVLCESVLKDLAQVRSMSKKLSEFAASGSLEESEAKEFLEKSRTFLSEAMDLITEDDELAADAKLEALDSDLSILNANLSKKGLTPDESDIAALMMKGLSDKEIANQLIGTPYEDISKVQKAMGVIREKLGAINNKEVITWCLRNAGDSIAAAYPEHQMKEDDGDEDLSGVEAISDKDLEDFLSAWKDSDHYTDFNLMLDRGFLDLALARLVGAGAIGPIDDTSTAALKRYHEYAKDGFESEDKDVKEFLKNVEIWIDPKTNEHAYIPQGDVDYFVSQSDLKKMGYEFDSAYDENGEDTKKTSLKESAEKPFKQIQMSEDSEVLGGEMKAEILWWDARDGYGIIRDKDKKEYYFDSSTIKSGTPKRGLMATFVPNLLKPDNILTAKQVVIGDGKTEDSVLGTIPKDATGNQVDLAESDTYGPWDFKAGDKEDQKKALVGFLEWMLEGRIEAESQDPMLDMIGDRVEDQLTGVSGEVNGQETQDIYGELTKGLSEEEIEECADKVEGIDEIDNGWAYYDSQYYISKVKEGKNKKPVDEAKGSGWGDLKPGAPLADISDVKVGDVFLDHSNKFDSKNVVKVEKVDTNRGIFYAHFVNPKNFNEKRLPDDRTFAVWDFEIPDGTYMKIAEGVDEAAKKQKDFEGFVGGVHVMARINGVDFNHGTNAEELDLMVKMRNFKSNAQKDYIRAKGKTNKVKVVKDWVKEFNPSQYLVTWFKEHDDDALEVYYTGHNTFEYSGEAKWIIKDWAGNIAFEKHASGLGTNLSTASNRFGSYDDAEEFLQNQLGDLYDVERDEFQIVQEEAPIEEGKAPKDFTLKELQDMPTTHVGQADDLKFDDGEYRVWLSRMTKDDGMPYDNQVTVERIVNGVWKKVKEYEAKSNEHLH